MWRIFSKVIILRKRLLSSYPLLRAQTLQHRQPKRRECDRYPYRCLHRLRRRTPFPSGIVINTLVLPLQFGHFIPLTSFLISFRLLSPSASKLSFPRLYFYCINAPVEVLCNSRNRYPSPVLLEIFILFLSPRFHLYSALLSNQWSGLVLCFSQSHLQKLELP
mgnify:CR=1 FL=1